VCFIVVSDVEIYNKVTESDREGDLQNITDEWK
jgi:hypothetical protein